MENLEEYLLSRATIRFHVMAKPIGPKCNLDCSYCFYLSKEQLLHSDNSWRMSDEVLEEFIKQYIEQQNYHEIIFSWQGGEPTLLGLDFFRKVVDLERKYCPPNKQVQNDLQTNGTLLDDEWCEFLKENNFLVGLSIDGPRELHDKHRLDREGKPTFDKVFNAVKLLHKHGIKFNALTSVNRDNTKEPLRVYRFLRDEVKPAIMQFTPVVEPKVFKSTAPQYWEPGSPDSVVTDWSVDAEEFGDFLCEIFDEWYKKDIGKVCVHYFEDTLGRYMGTQGGMCVFSELCGKALAIEHDGTVYACDHYVYPEYERGNIKDEILLNMISSKRQVAFGFRKRDSLPQHCKQCEYLFACYGECPKNRLLLAPDGEKGLNYLCSGLKKYFNHVDPYMKQLAQRLKTREMV